MDVGGAGTLDGYLPLLFVPNPRDHTKFPVDMVCVDVGVTKYMLICDNAGSHCGIGVSLHWCPLRVDRGVMKGHGHYG